VGRDLANWLTFGVAGWLEVDRSNDLYYRPTTIGRGPTVSETTTMSRHSVLANTAADELVVFVDLFIIFSIRSRHRLRHVQERMTYYYRTNSVPITTEGVEKEGSEGGGEWKHQDVTFA
jgi:hypothetical protein